MRILVDILHPAHVHFFRHAIDTWRGRGHEIAITLRDKDIARALLQRCGLAYENLGPAGAGLGGLARELLRRHLRLSKVVRRFRPDVMTGIAGISIAHVGSLKRIPSVVFTDTENATLSNRLTFPLATVVCTPACFGRAVRGATHRTYRGYHELAYLHPQRFTPDASILPAYGVREGEPFVVMRLISWGAAHDVHDRGFGDVREAIRRLEQYGRVLVSSELDLPSDLAAYQVTARPEQIHHLLAFARLFIGESATMASESAVLGTPAVFVSTSRRGYTDEQGERYDLVHTYSDAATAQEMALADAEAILADAGSQAAWQGKRDRMLAEQVDVTDFIVGVVEEYGRERQQRRRES